MSTDLLAAGSTDAAPSPVPYLTVGPPTLRMLNVDPRELRDNPRNLRRGIGDLTDLTASMAVVGILCPLVVIPSGDVVPDVDEPEVFQIVIGHRRKHAAIELGMSTVPCVVAADVGMAMQIIAQLAENGHRAGLTATEEAEAYHQLTLLDWSADQIAQVRAIPAAHVRSALQLRGLPQAAREAADAGTLTLDDAAAIAEFADEPAALGRIMKSAGAGWGFRHAVATERSKRNATAAKERVKAELVLAGVKVTSKPKQFGYAGTAVDARHLVDADDQPVDVDEVRTKPGFAAFVELVGDTANAVVYCADPDKYGYTRRRPSHGLSDDERVAREEADRARDALREQLTVATAVRRDFYQQTYGTARVAKRLFVEALREAVTRTAPGRFSDVDGLYGALGGVDGDMVAAAREDRLRRCLVAQWICAHEHNLAFASTRQGWALDAKAAAFWLDQLVADGYTVSDAEATLRQALTVDPDDGSDDGDAARLDETDADDAGTTDAEPAA